MLYHRLVLDRPRGKYDKERFLAYLKLPRHVVLRRPEVSAARSESGASPPISTPTSRDDAAAADRQRRAAGPQLPAALLRRCRPDYKEFEPYVNDVYLKHLFAETKIVDGLGDPEQWASLLPPEQFQQLKERVDIDFAFTNKTELRGRRGGARWTWT